MRAPLAAGFALLIASQAEARGRSVRRSVVLEGFEPIAAQVLRVVDGDTAWFTTPAGQVDVRVLGIDCPESRRNQKCEREGSASCEAQIPRGRVATLRARELLKVGSSVKLEPGDHGFKLDRYGRTLAYIRLSDGRDYGLQVLKEGLCADFSWKYPHPRQSAYVSGQKP